MDEQIERERRGLEAPGVSRPGTRRRPRLRALYWLVPVVLAGLVAWRMLGGSPTPSPRPPHGAGGPPQPVGIASATQGDVRVRLSGLGTVTPLATVTVRTQINGQLQQLGFQEGQLVHKGDFLAQIDPRPYQVALEQAQGQLAHDTALLAQSQVDLARYQTLNRQDSISKQQYQDQIYLVKQYQGTIAVDQAAIDNAKLNLIYCHITSPVDGRVGLRLVDPGNYVQTSDTSGLFVLTQLQPISVIFTLPEDDVPQVERQMRGGTLAVTVLDRANVSQLAAGTLETIDNQVDTTTGTVRLRAVFDNKDNELFPSQFVNAELLVETLHGVVTVPLAAVQHGTPGAYVFLLRPDRTVAMRPVKTGVADGERIEITDGLSAGDNVVVDGADRLRDGARVTIPGDGAGGAPGQAGARRQHQHRQAPQD